VKLGITPWYDPIHPDEFLIVKHLVFSALAWSAGFFYRDNIGLGTQNPKGWETSTVKPGKGPHLAATYRPILLLLLQVRGWFLSASLYFSKRGAY